MILHKLSRAGIVIATVMTAVAASFCLICGRQGIRAQNAKHAILAQDVRVMQRSLDSSRPSATPVVVELFTSEGCSSCPPADAFLAQLDRDQPIASADIMALGEHVDYWDQLGWHDRFSSSNFTQRQRSYQSTFSLDDVYTPQVIVNGSAQFNGTDKAGITHAIEQAAANTVPLLFTSVEVGPGNKITFTLANGPGVHSEYVRIYGAVVDPTDTTTVGAGENSGRTLHHSAVVRTFDMLGESWHMNQLGRHPFDLSAERKLDLNGARLVVFAQTKPFGPILGAASCILSTSHSLLAPGNANFPANPCPVAAPQ